MNHKKDYRKVEDILVDINQALTNNDKPKFLELHNEMVETIKEELTVEQRKLFDENMRAADQAILTERGKNVLTTEEKAYYNKLISAMSSKDPKQAIANLEAAMPETVIDRVLEDLRKNHPLLSKINFIPTGAMTRFIYNANGQQEAAWGELCDEIVKELTAGFKVVQTNLLKLSAFLPVCKQGLTFGPAYLDTLVRETLYEAIATGLEAGVIDGDGNDKPVGMTRQVGEGVSVTGGVYPRKAKVAVEDLSIKTVGHLVDMVATDDNGKERDVRDLVIICNQADYYSRVLPAVTVMAPDGSYHNTLPYDITIIPVSRGLKRGEALFGLAYRYAAFVGSELDGNIDYSDHQRFVQDQRIYIVKAFANGFPMDGRAFVLLDITKLAPTTYLVESVTKTASNDATLSALTLGAATLTPAFDAETTAYTATTSNATNALSATPANAGANVDVTLNGEAVNNGTAMEWATGENTLKIAVTAADGKTAKEYTVTVTKQ